MITGGDVLFLLRPNGGWVIYGDDFDSIRWDEGVEPLTKAEFDAGFDLVEEAQAKALAEAKAKRQSLLERLGITEEEARLLLA